MMPLSLSLSQLILRHIFTTFATVKAHSFYSNTYYKVWHLGQQKLQARPCVLEICSKSWKVHFNLLFRGLNEKMWSAQNSVQCYPSFEIYIWDIWPPGHIHKIKVAAVILKTQSFHQVHTDDMSTNFQPVLYRKCLCCNLIVRWSGHLSY